MLLLEQRHQAEQEKQAPPGDVVGVAQRQAGRMGREQRRDHRDDRDQRPGDHQAAVGRLGPVGPARGGGRAKFAKGEKMKFLPSFATR